MRMFIAIARKSLICIKKSLTNCAGINIKLFETAISNMQCFIFVNYEFSPYFPVKKGSFHVFNSI